MANEPTRRQAIAGVLIEFSGLAWVSRVDSSPLQLE
jgi:hypothetical protein